MNYWHDIPTSKDAKNDWVYSIIEIPKGSKMKYEYDKDYGILRLDRVLYTSTHYPANYGFIPQTYADDDDPLDILVFCSSTPLPLTLIRARVVGVFIMVDEDQMDEKIIAVSHDDPAYRNITTIDQLPSHIIEEMTHFFDVYKELEGKKTKVMKVKDAKAAHEVISRSQKRYADRLGKKASPKKK